MDNTEPQRNETNADRSLIDDMFNPEEAAHRLRISRTMVYKLMSSGELRSLTIGRRRFITHEAIERFKRMRERASLPPGSQS
jgi:excisionase family DNA binding protein